MQSLIDYLKENNVTFLVDYYLFYLDGKRKEIFIYHKDDPIIKYSSNTTLKGFKESLNILKQNISIEEKRNLIKQLDEKFYFSICSNQEKFKEFLNDFPNL